MVSKGASIPLQIDCGWWTRPGPEQPYGNWHYPISPQTWADLVCSVQLYYGEHLEMWVYVGYCMDLVLHDDAEALEGLWRHTMWYFPPRCPGTCTIALWSITLRPRRLVLLRSNPASSMKMNSWGCAAPSMAKILCKKKKENILLYYTYRTLTPSHRYLCSSQNGSMWYWYGTYSAATGFHQYCIVNVKDSYTYPYIQLEVLWPCHCSSQMGLCRAASWWCCVFPRCVWWWWCSHGLCCWTLACLQVFSVVAGGDGWHCLPSLGPQRQVPAVVWTGVGVLPQKVFESF